MDFAETMAPRPTALSERPNDPDGKDDQQGYGRDRTPSRRGAKEKRCGDPELNDW